MAAEVESERYLIRSLEGVTELGIDGLEKISSPWEPCSYLLKDARLVDLN